MPTDRDWKETTIRKIAAEGVKSVKDAAHKEQVQKQAAQSKTASQHNAIKKAAGEYVAQPVSLDWILTPHDLIERKRVLITPEQAATILEKTNTHNRPRTTREKTRLARKIEQRGWQYLHQGIAFDSNGRMIDGQLRCMLSVEMGFTMDVDVTVGMPPDTFYDVDTGDSRTPAHALAIEGETNVKALRGAITLVYWYEQSRVQLRHRRNRYELTNEEYVTLIQNKYGDALRHAVYEAMELYRVDSCPSFPVVPTAAAIYLIRRENPDSDKVDEFIRGIQDGTNLNDSDIRGPFRTYWYNLNSTVHGKRLRPRVEDSLGAWLRAWEMWVDGIYRDRFVYPKTATTPTVAKVTS